MSVDLSGKEIILSNVNNKSLKKTILEVGDNSIIIVDGSELEVEIKEIAFQKEVGSACDDEISKSRLLNDNFNGKLVIGEASCYLDADIERCLQHMYLQETSRLSITYYNSGMNLALHVSCVVKILSINNNEIFCDRSWKSKIESAKQQKEIGKNLVKENRMIEAFNKFSKSLKLLLSLDKTEDLEHAGESELNEILKLKIDLYNNLSFCQLQYNEYEAAVTLCNKALELDKNSEKALYRRGCAFMGMDDFEAAYADICQVLALDPNNAAAKSKAAILREKVKVINDHYKKVIKSMFV